MLRASRKLASRHLPSVFDQIAEKRPIEPICAVYSVFDCRIRTEKSNRRSRKFDDRWDFARQGGGIQFDALASVGSLALLVDDVPIFGPVGSAAFASRRAIAMT